MAKTKILPYNFKPQASFYEELPKGAIIRGLKTITIREERILSDPISNRPQLFNLSREQPIMLIQVDEEQTEKVKRYFRVIRNDEVFPEDFSKDGIPEVLLYIDSFTNEDSFIFHIFERFGVEE